MEEIDTLAFELLVSVMVLEAPLPNPERARFAGLAEIIAGITELE